MFKTDDTGKQSFQRDAHQPIGVDEKHVYFVDRSKGYGLWTRADLVQTPENLRLAQQYGVSPLTKNGKLLQINAKTREQILDERDLMKGDKGARRTAGFVRGGGVDVGGGGAPGKKVDDRVGTGAHAAQQGPAGAGRSRPSATEGEKTASVEGKAAPPPETPDHEKEKSLDKLSVRFGPSKSGKFAAVFFDEKGRESWSLAVLDLQKKQEAGRRAFIGSRTILFRKQDVAPLLAWGQKSESHLYYMLSDRKNRAYAFMRLDVLAPKEEKAGAGTGTPQNHAEETSCPRRRTKAVHIPPCCTVLFSSVNI